MQNLTFVTGNYGKYCSVKERFEKEGIEIKYFDCDLNEASINDISVISRGKAEDAYDGYNAVFDNLIPGADTIVAEIFSFDFTILSAKTFLK